MCVLLHVEMVHLHHWPQHCVHTKDQMRNKEAIVNVRFSSVREDVEHKFSPTCVKCSGMQQCLHLQEELTPAPSLPATSNTNFM